jgi:hypothetical protein
MVKGQKRIPYDNDVVPPVMAKMFDEDRITHRHGKADPEKIYCARPFIIIADCLRGFILNNRPPRMPDRKYRA